MNIISIFYNHKLILSILVFAFIVSLSFHPFTSAETLQNNTTAHSKLKTSPARSEEKRDNKNSNPQKEASGYKVFIDPETGEFIESPVEPPTETNALVSPKVESPASSELLEEEPAPGGGSMIVLPESYQYFSTATIDKQGKISTNCSRYPEHIDKPNQSETK